MTTLSSHVEVRVENTVEVRDSLHRLSDHAYRMALSAASHEKREACLAIAAAIKIALEPEQLTEGDVRTPRELRDARDVEGNERPCTAERAIASEERGASLKR